MGHRIALALIVAIWLTPVHSVRGQETSGAWLNFPLAGHPVAGRVTITGTASIEQFDHYELEFAHDPNPTETWFFMAQPSHAPVADGPLAEWDVTGITDGNYMLRLRVFRQDGTHLEAIVRGVIIQNIQPTATPAPTATSAPELTPSAAPTVPATATAPSVGQVGAVRPEAGGDGQTDTGFSVVGLRDAFWSGAGWTALAFVLLGIYVGIRNRFRDRIRYWARQLWASLAR